jgi:pimeloyl-ACP methyl ester carboxylesterase
MTWRVRTNALIGAGAVTAGLVAGLVIVVPAVTGAPPGADRRCRAVTLAVSLAPRQTADQRIAATYCEPAHWAAPRTVNVLTDGATYTGYWDWPDRAYSVVDRLLAAGRATLTYDRIGTGRSSRPLSRDVTLDTDVHVLDQILGWLQTKEFPQVVLHTHSYSAAVGIQLAATAGKVSQLVVTGFLHTPRDPAVAKRIYPANRDHPRWRDRDDGWLTTMPGTRQASFHGPSATKAVIDDDEARKDVVSAPAFGGFAAQQALPADSNPSARVTVPVVLVIGDQDAIFCGATSVLDCSDAAAVERFERPFYRSAPGLRVVVAPAGHSLALDPSGANTFAQIAAALDAPSVQR